MAGPLKFSGFNVPQNWGRNANYQGGQGGQLVKYAGITWRAIRPHNGRPPNTISGEWEQVPDTITAPVNPTPPGPSPTPVVPIKPPIPVTGTRPVNVVSNNVSVSVFTPSGDGAFSGLVPAPPGVAGTTLFLREDATWAAAGGGGGGTVTSVDFAAPIEFSVSGNPIVAAGTITLAWTSETQNTVLAAPDGAPGTPSFRALVTADLPAGTGTVTSVAMTVPTELSVSGSPITTSGTFGLTWNVENANLMFAGPATGVPATPTFRSMVAADLPNTSVIAGSYTYASITVDAQGRLTSASSGAAPTGTVTSVGLSLPASLYTISGSPVTTSGTLTGTLINQTANLVWAGPSTGVPAPPTFRALVTADMPAGTGTVTSVAQTVPTSILSVTGSPVTTTGTLAIALQTQTANLVWAGPTTGVPATPTFRSLVAADLPGGTGTVTSVAMTVPTELSVSGSPITTSGTFGLTWNSETQHFVFAAPSGSSGTPTFRALVASDLPAGTGTVTSVDMTVPTSILSVTGNPITTSGTLAVALATQTANTVWSGPTTGSAATPTFRALVVADMPVNVGASIALFNYLNFQ